MNDKNDLKQSMDKRITPAIMLILYIIAGVILLFLYISGTCRQWIQMKSNKYKLVTII